MAINCKHYDKENGWCKLFSNFSHAMPDVEYCVEGACPHMTPERNTITIDAKYNIGDEMWFADYIYDEFCPVKRPAKIIEICIEITEKKTTVCYWATINYGDYVNCEKYAEDVCFASYEECVKWCKEQNKQSATTLPL